MKPSDHEDRLYENRLAELRGDMSQKDFAESIGLKQANYYKYESGLQGLKSDLIKRICKKYECSAEWLLKLDEDPNFVSFVNTDSIDVPYYGHIAAGTPIGFDTSDGEMECPASVRRKYPESFFLKVDGDSMSRRVPNGAIALIDPTQKEPTNDRDCYAVCVNGDRATIKRVRKLENGIELIPDSYDPTYRSKVFDYNEDSTKTVTVFGKVVWYMMPFDFEV